MAQGQAQLLNLELEAAPAFHWDPFPEDNWYLGYRTQQVNPSAVVRQLNSSAADVALDISDCLGTVIY